MKRGFTLLEVMISLVVMTIGASGLFGLQGLIARSNLYSRHLTAATEVLETWTERLKADAIHWTAPAPSTTPNLNLANTRYLQAVGANAGAWIAAGANANLGRSPALNLSGADVALVAQNQDQIFYCTSYRLDWVVPGESLRAEVRVFWPRENTPANFATSYPLCTGNQAAVSQATYHVIQASTVLRWTPLP